MALDWEKAPVKVHFKSKVSQYSSHHRHFIDVESRLGKVTDEEDEHYGCEDGGHGVVPPVRVPGLEGVVEGSGSSDCSVYQPVED